MLGRYATSQMTWRSRDFGFLSLPFANFLQLHDRSRSVHLARLESDCRRTLTWTPTPTTVSVSVPVATSAVQNPSLRRLPVPGATRAMQPADRYENHAVPKRYLPVDVRSGRPRRVPPASRAPRVAILCSVFP